tara:strand:- start:99582 stop:99752 length:171 start_codon:yes stop_codon:yes gene_type:complete
MIDPCVVLLIVRTHQFKNTAQREKNQQRLRTILMRSCVEHAAFCVDLCPKRVQLDI